MFLLFRRKKEPKDEPPYTLYVDRYAVFARGNYRWVFPVKGIAMPDLAIYEISHRFRPQHLDYGEVITDSDGVDWVVQKINQQGIHGTKVLIRENCEEWEYTTDIEGITLFVYTVKPLLELTKKGPSTAAEPT